MCIYEAELTLFNIYLNLYVTLSTKDIFISIKIPECNGLCIDALLIVTK